MKIDTYRDGIDYYEQFGRNKDRDYYAVEMNGRSSKKLMTQSDAVLQQHWRKAVPQTLTVQ